MKEPRCVSIYSSNRVYVGEYGNDRVSVFTSEGQFVMSFGTGISVGGLAVDLDSGVLCVCSFFRSCVQLF